jgi:hypothetical protein
MELSSNRPPVLDGTNFDHWKAKMTAYLKAIDEDVWMACEVKYSPPVETVDGPPFQNRVPSIQFPRRLNGLQIVGR